MKVLTTAIVADIRNKLNGTVFAKNRYGLYGRTKVTPVNPQTTRQQANRAVFGNQSTAWRGLTQDQRNTWIAAAPLFPVTDVFGNSQILSGQALFVRLNSNLVNIGESIILTAPTPVSFPAVIMTGLTADISSVELNAAMSVATDPPGFKSLFYATPNIPASRLYVKNRLRSIGVIGIASSTANLLSGWSPQFGTMIAGQRITARFVLVSTTTGQMSVPSEATTIVVP